VLDELLVDGSGGRLEFLQRGPGDERKKSHLKPSNIQPRNAAASVSASALECFLAARSVMEGDAVVRVPAAFDPGFSRSLNSYD